MDTSAGACSAAVHDDGRIIERLQEMPRGHAEALLPMIVAVMREAGREFRDLDLIAVTVGPGAFTGLRVGTRRGTRNRAGGRFALLRRNHAGGHGRRDRLADAGGSSGAGGAR